MISSVFHAACRPPQKPIGRPPTPKLVGSPGSEDPGNLRPVKITPESPQQTRSLKEEQDEEKHILSPPLPRPQPVGQNKPTNEPVAATGRCPPHQVAAVTSVVQLQLKLSCFQSVYSVLHPTSPQRAPLTRRRRAESWLRTVGWSANRGSGRRRSAGNRRSRRGLLAGLRVCVCAHI